MLRKYVQTGFRLLKMNQTLRNCTKFIQSPKIPPSRCFMLSGGVAVLKSNLDNIDLNLQAASEMGETAVIEVMEMLREAIVETSYKYRKCLEKQIEIIKEATDLGPLSVRWDDLPEYRTLAADLNQQLNNFTVVLNAVGQIAYEESLKYITDNKTHINAISCKYRELEDLLRSQMIEIQTLEKYLLQLRRESIVFSLGTVS